MAELTSMSLQALELEREKADGAIRAAREQKLNLAREIQRRLGEQDAAAFLEGKSEGEIETIVKVATQRLGAAAVPVKEK
jgi:hypothetical protein